MSTDVARSGPGHSGQQEIALARRRIAELAALGKAGELLDPSLDPPQLVQRALDLSLQVLPADAALLVLRTHDGESAHFQLRGEAAMRELDLRSKLARQVLATGRGGVRRGRRSPGAKAVAEILGAAPALRIAVPLRRRGAVFGALEVAYRHDPGPDVGEDSPALRSVADHLAVSLDNARLVRDHARRVQELSTLYDIGTKISSHLDLDAVLGAIIGSFVELVPADAAGIFLIDRDTGEIRKQALRGYEHVDLDEMSLRIGRGILGWVAKNGEGVIVPDVRKDDRYEMARPETRSEMAAPLWYEDRVIGVFNLESDRSDAYTLHDLDLLLTFGNQAAISIMNARLHEEVKAKRRLDEQLRIARDIQRTLLPRSAPSIPGHTLAGRNESSIAVGGDYFDFLPLSGDRWAVLVADVSGNGIPAALIMAGFRAEIRASLRHIDDPRRVLGEVNRHLCRELDPDHFVTAFLAAYSPGDGTLTYSSAGHEPALLVRADGRVERLEEGGLLLGVFEEADYREASVRLEPGDRLLIHTDGLSDAPDPWGDLLGEEGILRLLRESGGTPPEKLPWAILERARRGAAVPPEEADDRTLVVLGREPATA